MVSGAWCVVCFTLGRHWRGGASGGRGRGVSSKRRRDTIDRRGNELCPLACPSSFRACVFKLGATSWRRGASSCRPSRSWVEPSLIPSNETKRGSTLARTGNFRSSPRWWSLKWEGGSTERREVENRDVDALRTTSRSSGWDGKRSEHGTQ